MQLRLRKLLRLRPKEGAALLKNSDDSAELDEVHQAASQVAAANVRTIAAIQSGAEVKTELSDKTNATLSPSSLIDFSHRYAVEIKDGVVDLSHKNLTDNDVPLLVKFLVEKNVASVNLSNNKLTLACGCAKELEKLVSIQSINLNDNFVTNAGMQAFAKLPQLKTLLINHNKSLGDEQVFGESGIIAVVSSKICKIETLHVEGRVLRESTVRALKKNTSLVEFCTSTGIEYQYPGISVADTIHQNRLNKGIKPIEPPIGVGSVPPLLASLPMGPWAL